MTTASMKGWQASQFGNVEDVLHLTEVAIPEPGEGEARVRVGLLIAAGG